MEESFPKAAMDRSEIDSISERFEEFWSAANCGPTSLLDFLRKERLVADPLLLIELVQVDMERTWMNWHRTFDARMMSSDPETLIAEIQSIASLDDYVGSLNMGLNREQLAELATWELNARNLWGDCIVPKAFGEVLALESTDITPKILLDFQSTDDTGEEAFDLAVAGTTIIGRRNRSESSTRRVLQTASGYRIVIAGHAETGISRKQISARVMTPDFICLKNESRISPIVASTGGTMAPGETRIFKLPFQVRLYQRRLVFRCATT